MLLMQRKGSNINVITMLPLFKMRRIVSSIAITPSKGHEITARVIPNGHCEVTNAIIRTAVNSKGHGVERTN